jgi:DNA polymerase III delta subunit
MRPVEFCAVLEKGKTGAAYFLRGPDRFLHEECRAAVLGSLPAGTREWCFTEFEFEPGQLRRELDNAYQMPMLGNHNFLYWTDPEDFGHADDEDLDALDTYLKRPASFTTILFAAYQPDRRRRFIQCLEKKTEVVDVQPPGRTEATAWVIKYVRQAGVEIRPDLAESIAAQFDAGDEPSGRSKTKGVNLLWLRTELDKLLVACAGSERIEKHHLDIMVAAREEHEIGKMLAAIADRQLSRAVTALRELLAGKEPETLLLWCVGDLFRQALKSAPVAGRQYRNWPGRSNPFSTYEIAPRATRTYSREELISAIRLVHGTDLAMKSSWKDSRVLLETLLWQIMAGTAVHGSPAWLEEVGQGASSG